MRQRILITAVVFVLTSFGCGGGGGGDGVPPHAPVISNLHYSPNTAPQSMLATNITGSTTFHDIDGNIATFTLNIYENQSGAQVGTTTVNLAGAIGSATDGYFDITVMVTPSNVGAYTFGIHVTDSAGLQSNVLTGPFTVTP